MHKSNDITLILPDEAATLACAERFARTIQPGLTVYMHGNLGAGKTTFVRGVLHALGYSGKVKSPTYTLLETYQIKLNVNFKYNLYHFDLYRFNDQDEWDSLGFRDYFNSESVCVIEWPEKAGDLLPMADIDIQLFEYNGGRRVRITAQTALGNACLEQF